MLSVYAKFFSRSHDAVIRVYADGGNVITSTRKLCTAPPPLAPRLGRFETHPASRACLFNRVLTRRASHFRPAFRYCHYE